MPMRAQHPCAQYGCPALLDHGQQYCVQHQHLAPQRPSPRQRGLGAAHQAMAMHILERDQWICQICHERIDRNAPPRTPRSASVDHIKPISMGGDGSASNLRAAHYGCNSSRGNRQTERLPALQLATRIRGT